MNLLLDKRFSFLMQKIPSLQGLVLWGGGQICFSFYKWWQTNRPSSDFPKCIESSIESPTRVNGIDLLPPSLFLSLKPNYILITTINSQDEVLEQIHSISSTLSKKAMTLVNSKLIRQHIIEMAESNESEILYDLLFDFPDESLIWKLISISTNDPVLKDKFLECYKSLYCQIFW
jgi:hypothetical protein